MVEKGLWGIIYKNSDSNEWFTLERKKGFWYADPMILEYNDEILLFIEAYDMTRQIGTIALSVYQDGVFSPPVQIIKSNYHMSYPCVFIHENTMYMIPETCQNGTIELWKSENSIFEWRKEKKIYEGLCCVDSTVVEDGNTMYVISYSQRKPWITYLFELDMDKEELKLLDCFPNETNNRRPAGYVFSDDNGTLYRPVQNSEKVYGESIIINRVNSLLSLDEKKEDQIFASSFDCDSSHFIRTHTISKLNNLQVFDVMKTENVSWFYSKRLIERTRNVLFRIRFQIKYRMLK